MKARHRLNLTKQTVSDDTVLLIRPRDVHLAGGRHTHRFDGTQVVDRLVEFSTAEYRDVMHGYAATIHKTQGATADRAMVLASPYMDRHATYVAMSRHIHEANLYYSEKDFADFDKLEQRLSREARKDTTLDYAPPPFKLDPDQRSVPETPTDDPRPAHRMADLVAMRIDPARRDELRAYRSARVAELRDILRNRTVDEDSSPGPGV